MPYPFYKVLHLAGILLLFLAWGALLYRAGLSASFGKKPPRSLMLAHGLALLIAFVAGFGLLARLGIHWPWPAWVWAKALIWLFLGASVGLLKRRPASARWMWWFLPSLGATASFLAIYKPF